MELLVEFLLSLHKAPSFSPSTQAVHTCDPSTPEVEPGDQNFKTILVYVSTLRPAWMG